MSFQKPENAITRANEFIHVGDKIGALNTLRAVITSRKFRVWSSTMERLMLMYVDLSVELRKGKEAKDGLHQYRNICQQVNVGSLGKVIERFLEQAEASAKDAQSEADAITLAAIEDLEAEDAPESILLERVSGEDNKDRTDREIVTPWLKFLWETYRTVLDILRNNSKLEYLYQTTAQRAFEFCEKYKRNTEFRRLSEILRNHLNILPKYSHQTNAISLSSPESMQFHLETRFSQLNVACNLELWQDAFRSVEDLHGLMNMAKKPLKPQLMANYYEKLTQIFWVSGNHLFHAHAWNKFYNLSRNQNKNLTEEELKLMSSTVLLASLCIPLKAQNGEFFDLDDVEKQKTSRLAVLLGSVSNFLSRESILEELIARNGPVLPELHDLYALLEVKFHPLEFVQSLKPKLDFVSGHPSLSKYAEPLQKIVFIRCLQQLSRVYKTMKIEALAKMIDFVDPTQLEKMMVEAVKNNFVSLRIDHQNSQINFGKEDLGSDKLRNQLTLLARNLKTVVGHISPESPEAKQAKKEALFGKILQTLERDHKRILERKKITERRKEIREALSILEEKEHYEQQEKAAKKKRKEQPKIKKAKPKEENLPFGIKKPEEPSEDALAKLAAAKKAKREGERRQANIAKKKDFLIRALREEERELLVAHYEEQQAQDKEWYEEQRDEYIKKQELAHERKLAEKRRLERMHEVRATFEKELEERREQKYQKLKAEQDERLKETREKVAEDRKKREIEREKRRQELEEQKKKQEEARRLAEEERKKKQEQREKEEREAEARAAELLKERESQPEWPQDPGRQDEESDDGVISGMSLLQEADWIENLQGEIGVPEIWTTGKVIDGVVAEEMTDGAVAEEMTDGVAAEGMTDGAVVEEMTDGVEVEVEGMTDGHVDHQEEEGQQHQDEGMMTDGHVDPQEEEAGEVRTGGHVDPQEEEVGEVTTDGLVDREETTHGEMTGGQGEGEMIDGQEGTEEGTTDRHAEGEEKTGGLGEETNPEEPIDGQEETVAGLVVVIGGPVATLALMAIALVDSLRTLMMVGPLLAVSAVVVTDFV
eukprot:CAMPEP_0174255592 /NCGR_PEP_ID=MMETSP0439-20130205/4911_1 /TAXON_ID=0 /ORGANISM="Stereomyxa ramosa, Strain Chinc5" /LENGTH=1054 /DNA_ID=CAMNT_0015337833 /DNA_START=66 /DNA_END=3231 /DNA_ORIENTATION=-